MLVADVIIGPFSEGLNCFKFAQLRNTGSPAAFKMRVNWTKVEYLVQMSFCDIWKCKTNLIKWSWQTSSVNSRY